MFDPLHKNEWAYGQSFDSDHDVKIEELLLTGLDHSEVKTLRITIQQRLLSASGDLLSESLAPGAAKL